MSVKLIAIAALGKSRQIGLSGKLPWKLPEEYSHFTHTVKDQYVLIGRKNFELHDRKIEDAKAIVLTRDKSYRAPDTLVLDDLRKLVALAEEESIEKIYVIGGAEIYRLTLPYLCEFICSEIDYDGEADTFFPDYKHYDWSTVSTNIHPKWVVKRMLKEPDPLR